MMRLIDADKVLGVLRELDTRSFSGTMHIKNVMYLINEQPTAYDVDEVMEQLEIYSNKDEAEQLGTIPVVELEDVFKIVKGGGIYE
nr:MAG TPA: hypothetical protein [Caudoviricetes sp.]